jgi:hypothetical protein
MQEEIKQLQARLKTHWQNYEALKSDKLYSTYRHMDYRPTEDELDGLLAKALARIPKHAYHIPLDIEWRLILTLETFFDPGLCADRAAGIKNLIPSLRAVIDHYQNWRVSVLSTYELILEKNLKCIHADLARIKELRAVVEPGYAEQLERAEQAQSQPQQAYKPKVLLFISQHPVVEDDGKSCDWLSRDYTSPFSCGIM